MHGTAAIQATALDPTNELLFRFGPDVAGRLVAAGRHVSYSAGEPLWAEGDEAQHILFLDRGLITLQWVDIDGGTAEVDMVGPEGAVGLIEALARTPFAFDIKTELASEGLLVPADVVRELIETDREVADASWSYAIEGQTRARRGVGCASRHSAGMRLADYLLSIDLSSGGGRLRITQEMLAGALGVYRTTVTALLARFADDALITAGRGWLMIVNRNGLERVACGCRRREHHLHAAE